MLNGHEEWFFMCYDGTMERFPRNSEVVRLAVTDKYSIVAVHIFSKSRKCVRDLWRGGVASHRGKHQRGDYR